MASCRMHQQCDRQVRTLPTLWCCAWRLIAGASTRARSRACTSATGVGSARITMSSGSTCGPANPNQANAGAAGAQMLDAEVCSCAHVELCCPIDATWSRTATPQNPLVQGGWVAAQGAQGRRQAAAVRRTSGTPPTAVDTTSSPAAAASTIAMQNASVRLAFRKIWPRTCTRAACRL